MEENKMEEIKRNIKQIKTQLKLLDDDSIEPISYPKLSPEYSKIKKETKEGEKTLQKINSIKVEIEELKEKLTKLEKSDIVIEDKKKKNESLQIIYTKANEQMSDYINTVNKYLSEHTLMKRYYLETKGKCLDLYDENTVDVVDDLRDFKEKIEIQDNLRKNQKTEKDKQNQKKPKKKKGKETEDKAIKKFFKSRKGGGLGMVQVLLQKPLDNVILFFKEKDAYVELKKQIQLIKNVPIPYSKEQIEQYIENLYKLNNKFITNRVTLFGGKHRSVEFKFIPIPSDPTEFSAYQAFVSNEIPDTDSFLEIHKYRAIHPFDENWICKEVRANYAKQLYQALVDNNMTLAAQLIKPVFLNDATYRGILQILLSTPSFDEEKKHEDAKKALTEDIAKKNKIKEELTVEVSKYMIMGDLSIDRQLEVRQQIKGRILDEYNTISENIKQITSNLSTVSTLLKDTGFVYTSSDILIKANQEACQAIYWNARSLVSMYTCMFPYTFRPKTQLSSLVDRIYALFRNSSRTNIAVDTSIQYRSSDFFRTNLTADTSVEYRRESFRKLIKLKREIKQYKDYVNIIDLSTYTSSKDTFYKDNIVRIAKEVILNSLFDKKNAVTAAQLEECSAINRYFVSEEYADQILQEHVILMYSIFHKMMYMGTPELVTTILKRNSITDKMGKINEYIRMYKFLIKSVKTRYSIIKGNEITSQVDPLYLNNAPLLSKPIKGKIDHLSIIRERFPNSMKVPKMNTEYQGLQIQKGGSISIDQYMKSEIKSGTITFSPPSTGKNYEALTKNVINAPVSILHKIQFYYAYCKQNKIQKYFNYYLELPPATLRNIDIHSINFKVIDTKALQQLQDMKLRIEETVLSSPFKDKSYELFELAWMNIQNDKLMFITEYIVHHCINKLIVSCSDISLDDPALYKTTLTYIHGFLANVSVSDSSANAETLVPNTWGPRSHPAPTRTYSEMFYPRLGKGSGFFGMNKGMKGGTLHTTTKIDEFIRDTPILMKDVIDRQISMDLLNDMLVYAEQINKYNSKVVSLIRMYASDYILQRLLKEYSQRTGTPTNTISFTLVTTLLLSDTDTYNANLLAINPVNHNPNKLKIFILGGYLTTICNSNNNSNMELIQHNFILTLGNIGIHNPDPEYILIMACNKKDDSHQDKHEVVLANMSISKMIILNTLKKMKNDTAATAEDLQIAYDVIHALILSKISSGNPSNDEYNHEYNDDYNNEYINAVCVDIMIFLENVNVPAIVLPHPVSTVFTADKLYRISVYKQILKSSKDANKKTFCCMAILLEIIQLPQVNNNMRPYMKLLNNIQKNSTAYNKRMIDAVLALNNRTITAEYTLDIKTEAIETYLKRIYNDLSNFEDSQENTESIKILAKTVITSLENLDVYTRTSTVNASVRDKLKQMYPTEMFRIESYFINKFKLPSFTSLRDYIFQNLKKQIDNHVENQTGGGVLSYLGNIIKGVGSLSSVKSNPEVMVDSIYTQDAILPQHNEVISREITQKDLKDINAVPYHNDSLLSWYMMNKNIDLFEYEVNQFHLKEEPLEKIEHILRGAMFMEQVFIAILEIERARTRTYLGNSATSMIADKYVKSGIPLIVRKRMDTYNEFINVHHAIMLTSAYLEQTFIISKFDSMDIKQTNLKKLRTLLTELYSKRTHQQLYETIHILYEHYVPVDTTAPTEKINFKSPFDNLIMFKKDIPDTYKEGVKQYMQRKLNLLGTSMNKKMLEKNLNDLNKQLQLMQQTDGVDQADPTKPDPTKPDPTKPDPTNPDPTKPDPTKPDPTKPDPTKPDPTKLDPTTPAPAKLELVKPAPAKLAVKPLKGGMKVDSLDSMAAYEVDPVKATSFRKMANLVSRFNTLYDQIENETNIVEKQKLKQQLYAFVKEENVNLDVNPIPAILPQFEWLCDVILVLQKIYTPSLPSFNSNYISITGANDEGYFDFINKFGKINDLHLTYVELNPNENYYKMILQEKVNQMVKKATISSEVQFLNAILTYRTATIPKLNNELSTSSVLDTLNSIGIINCDTGNGSLNETHNTDFLFATVNPFYPMLPCQDGGYTYIGGIKDNVFVHANATIPTYREVLYKKGKKQLITFNNKTLEDYRDIFNRYPNNLYKIFMPLLKPIQPMKGGDPLKDKILAKIKPEPSSFSIKYNRYLQEIEKKIKGFEKEQSILIPVQIDYNTLRKFLTYLPDADNIQKVIKQNNKLFDSDKVYTNKRIYTITDIDYKNLCNYFYTLEFTKNKELTPDFIKDYDKISTRNTLDLPLNKTNIFFEIGYGMKIITDTIITKVFNDFQDSEHLNRYIPIKDYLPTTKDAINNTISYLTQIQIEQFIIFFRRSYLDKDIYNSPIFNQINYTSFRCIMQAIVDEINSDVEPIYDYLESEYMRSVLDNNAMYTKALNGISLKGTNKVANQILLKLCLNTTKDSVNNLNDYRKEKYITDKLENKSPKDEPMVSITKRKSIVQEKWYELELEPNTLIFYQSNASFGDEFLTHTNGKESAETSIFLRTTSCLPKPEDATLSMDKLYSKHAPRNVWQIRRKEYITPMKISLFQLPDIQNAPAWTQLIQHVLDLNQYDSIQLVYTLFISTLTYLQDLSNRSDTENDEFFKDFKQKIISYNKLITDTQLPCIKIFQKIHTCILSADIFISFFLSLPDILYFIGMYNNKNSCPLNDTIHSIYDMIHTAFSYVIHKVNTTHKIYKNPSIFKYIYEQIQPTGILDTFSSIIDNSIHEGEYKNTFNLCSIIVDFKKATTLVVNSQSDMSDVKMSNLRSAIDNVNTKVNEVITAIDTPPPRGVGYQYQDFVDSRNTQVSILDTLVSDTPSSKNNYDLHRQHYNCLNTIVQIHDLVDKYKLEANKVEKAIGSIVDVKTATRAYTSVNYTLANFEDVVKKANDTRNAFQAIFDQYTTGILNQYVKTAADDATKATDALDKDTPIYEQLLFDAATEARNAYNMRNPPMPQAPILGNRDHNNGIANYDYKDATAALATAKQRAHDAKKKYDKAKHAYDAYAAAKDADIDALTAAVAAADAAHNDLKDARRAFKKRRSAETMQNVTTAAEARDKADRLVATTEDMYRRNAMNIRAQSVYDAAKARVYKINIASAERTKLGQAMVNANKDRDNINQIVGILRNTYHEFTKYLKYYNSICTSLNKLNSYFKDVPKKINDLSTDDDFVGGSISNNTLSHIIRYLHYCEKLLHVVKEKGYVIPHHKHLMDMIQKRIYILGQMHPIYLPHLEKTLNQLPMEFCPKDVIQETLTFVKKCLSLSVLQTGGWTAAEKAAWNLLTPAAKAAQKAAAKAAAAAAAPTAPTGALSKRQQRKAAAAAAAKAAASGTPATAASATAASGALSKRQQKKAAAAAKAASGTPAKAASGTPAVKGSSTILDEIVQQISASLLAVKISPEAIQDALAVAESTIETDASVLAAALSGISTVDNTRALDALVVAGIPREQVSSALAAIAKALLEKGTSITQIANAAAYALAIASTRHTHSAQAVAAALSLLSDAAQSAVPDATEVNLDTDVQLKYGELSDSKAKNAVINAAKVKYRIEELNKTKSEILDKIKEQTTRSMNAAKEFDKKTKEKSKLEQDKVELQTTIAELNTQLAKLVAITTGTAGPPIVHGTPLTSLQQIKKDDLDKSILSKQKELDANATSIQSLTGEISGLSIQITTAQVELTGLKEKQEENKKELEEKIKEGTLADNVVSRIISQSRGTVETDPFLASRMVLEEEPIYTIVIVGVNDPDACYDMLTANKIYQKIIFCEQ